MANNKNALQDALNWLGGAATNAGKAVVQAAQGFGNAFSSGKDLRTYQPTQPQDTAYTLGESFATPIATIPHIMKSVGDIWNDYSIFSNKNLNQLGNNPLTKAVTQAIPKADFSRSIENPILRTAASIPESLYNDFSQSPETFRQFSSGAGKDTAQQQLARLATSIGLPALDLATFGQLGTTKQALAQAAKESAGQTVLKQGIRVGNILGKEGAKVGGANAFLRSLGENGDAKSVPEQLAKTIIPTAEGTALGYGLGFATGTVSYIGGKKLNQFITDRKTTDFFKKANINDPGMGHTPQAIRESIAASKLQNTPFGKMALEAADQAEAQGKYLKFSEEATSANGKIRAGAANINRSIDLIDPPQPAGMSVNPMPRPNHQAALEEALANNDPATIKSILDSIPADDPYKVQMEHLFRPMAEGEIPMKTVDSPIGRNPMLNNQTPVSEGVDKVVYRAVDSSNPHAVLGDGTYVGEAPEAVQRYGKDVQRFIIDKNAKILDLRPGNSLDEFTMDAIKQNSDEFTKIAQDKGEDAALGWVMKKHATDLGFDGIRGDDMAYGTAVFNKDMIRPDTSVPEGIHTIDDVQKQINDLAAEASPNKQLLENPELLSQRLKEDPGSIINASQPEIAQPEVTTVPKPQADYSETPGLDQIYKGKEKEPHTVQGTVLKTKTLVQKAYDAAVDKFDPIFRTVRQGGGDETQLENAFAGYYGVGSKAQARVDQGLMPILKDAEKQVGADNFREALIDYATIERGNRGVPGYDAEKAKYGLDVLMNKLTPDQQTSLQTLLDRWYAYHRDGIEQAVKAGVLSPDFAQNMMDRNQFYTHFDKAIDKVDDMLAENAATQTNKASAGSISKQEVFYALKGGEGQIRDPLQSAIIDTYKLQSTIERNKVANAAVDSLDAVGQAKQLSSAENKVKRESIFSDLAELKPIKNKVERTVKTLTRVGKRLEQAKNDVAQEGIQSVKNAVKGENNIIAKNDKVAQVIGEATNRSENALLKNNAQESIDALSRQSTLPDLTGEISGKKARSLMDDLINMDEYKLDRFKQRLGSLDSKTQRVIDDIDTYRTLLDQINEKRANMFSEARLLKDASTRGKSVIYRLKNGIKEAWEVDPMIADSLRGLNSQQASWLVKLFNPATKVFRATATGLNLDFMLPNVVRDAQSAYINYGVNPVDYVKAFTHYVKKDDMYEQWLASGGKLSRTSLDQSFLEDQLANLGDKKLVKSDRGILVKGISGVGKVLHSIGDLSEQPTRLAAFEKIYNQQLSSGVTKEAALARAAYASQEATANFARGGYATPEFNALYAFVNARIQGLDRLARTVKKDPKGALGRIGVITAGPALATYAWNRMFPAYYDDRIVPQTDKDKNFIIMLSNTPIDSLRGAQYIKIPKGDVGRVANVLESFLAWADNHKDASGKNDFSHVVGTILQGFSPIDIPEGRGLFGTIAGTLTPTALKPPQDIWANKSWNNFDIVPSYKENLPAQYQTSSITSPTYKWLGERLNISPAQLQYAIEGYGTSFAKAGTMVTDPFFSGMGYSSPDAKGEDINRTPIAHRFLGGEHKSAEEAATSLEKQANSIDFQLRDIKSAIKRGDIPEDAGYAQRDQLMQQQQDLLDRADSIRSGASFTPSETPSPTPQTSSDAGSLIPSAFAEANPSDIATLLKADEKKKDQLDRWSMNPTEANAQKLGLDYKDSTMWLLSKLPDEVESKYITSDVFKQDGKEAQDAQAMEYIQAGNLTNGKVDTALEQGDIDTDQAKHLKDLIKQYKIGKGLLKGPKAKKIKVASLRSVSIGRVPTIKLPRIKVPSMGRIKGLKSGSLSSGSSAKLKAPTLTLSTSDYKPGKVKLVGRVPLR